MVRKGSPRESLISVLPTEIIIKRSVATENVWIINIAYSVALIFNITFIIFKQVTGTMILRDSIRKAREAFLIKKGRTIDPDGLNIREETY